MIGSSFTKLIFSVGSLMVALPSGTWGQTLLQPTYSTYPDTTTLFTPYVGEHSHRKTLRHHGGGGGGGGGKKASSNWDRKAPHKSNYYQPEAQQSAQYYQPETQQSAHYDNHRPSHSSHYNDEYQQHAPQASHNQQISEPSHHSPSWGGADESSHDGSRVHFHVSGHKGPKSYRFGYDTGKGKARHFRYEERDEHGVVHGRYGYHDKHGKMHVFHYQAHPHHGYHANEVSPHKYGRR